jgi:hypothetical protein
MIAASGANRLAMMYPAARLVASVSTGDQASQLAQIEIRATKRL